jgi:organic radical activating enzyme
MCNIAQVEVFVKIIISSQTKREELEQAAEMVAAVSPEVPVFLQPVTPLAASEVEARQVPVMLAPAAERVLEWQALIKRQLKRVRVVPQTHKILGQL